MTAHQLYAACDHETQGLLLNCTWGLIAEADILTLLIKCPIEEVYWHILGSLSLLAEQLENLMEEGAIHIRVYPPPGSGSPLEVGARAIASHRNLP